MSTTIYLAGPDVFYPEPVAAGQRLKATLSKMGIAALYPMDAEIEELEKRKRRRRIYEENMALIDRADGVLANFSPFRGPSADPGTVFEAAYALGRKKPVVVYCYDEAISYLKRCELLGLRAGDTTTDQDGNLIEDFDAVDNLMLTESFPWHFGQHSFTQAAEDLKARVCSL